MRVAVNETLGPLSSNSPGQLDVFRHDGHPLSVDGTEVSVFEQSDQVSFASLLQAQREYVISSLI